MFLEIALAIVAILICICGLVALVVSIWLAIKYVKFNRKENRAGLTGEQVARKILDKENDPDMKKRIRLYPIITSECYC